MIIYNYREKRNMSRTDDKFQVNITKNLSGDKIFNIIWHTQALDNKVFSQVDTFLRSSSDYSVLSGKKMKELSEMCTKLNSKYKSSLNLEQLISIRNIVIKDKIIKNYNRMNIQIAKIAREYTSGRGILELSTKYDFPPMNLLRGIFLELGMNAKQTIKIFVDSKKGRDLKQYQLAESYDAESTFNQQEIANIAAKNEVTIVEFFKKLGINLKTQDDLTSVQVENLGRPVLTPDILFLDVVYINGVRVHWLDYKDYIGTKVNFLYKSNLSQAQKYFKEWGLGVLCYHHGYVAGVSIPGSIILDARSLPIKFNTL